MAAPSDLVVLATDGPIATITLNRPDAMNAMDLALADGFLGAVRAVAADEAVRTVILRGAGPAFCAGGDMATFARNLDDPRPMVDDILGRLNEAMRLLVEGPRTFVASVHGLAVGVGLSIAIQADFCLAAASARFMPGYPMVGVSPDGGGTTAAVERLGVRGAIRFFLGEETVDAQRAFEIGLVELVTQDDQLEERTRAFAERLARHSPLAVAHTKALLRSAARTPLADQLEAEKEAVAACMTSEFYRSAVRNFKGL